MAFILLACRAVGSVRPWLIGSQSNIGECVCCLGQGHSVNMGGFPMTLIHLIIFGLPQFSDYFQYPFMFLKDWAQALFAHIGIISAAKT